MPMNHTMTRDDDANQSAGNPSGKPDARQYYDADRPMTFDELRAEIRALMAQPQDKSQKPQVGGWFS